MEFTSELELSALNEKLYFTRLSKLYLLHEAFTPDDFQLSLLLNVISNFSILPQCYVTTWLENNQINRQKLFSAFPQAFGQWMDLSTERTPEERFWRMFLKRLLRSSMMLVIYGKSGTGKTKFINELVIDLDEQQ